MEPPRHRVVLDESALQAGLDALAARLRQRIGEQDVTVVVLLGGAILFAADLVRRLPPGLVLDFLRIQTYGAARQPVRAPVADWLPHAENIRARHVLLLDDILDTGRTLAEAERFLREEMGAAQITKVVLVDKPARRQVAIQADDCVLRMDDDLFLVGYGLDLAGRYRNLPRVLALEPGP